MGRKSRRKKRQSALKKDVGGVVHSKGYVLALEYLKTGQLAAAEGQCRRILDANPGNADALQLAGLVARQQGDYSRATAFFSDGIAAEPDNPYLYEQLGRLRMLEKRFEAAEASFRAALALKPDGASFYICLGNSLQRQGRYPDAVTAYERALDLDDGNVGARCGLGNTLRLMGRVEAALKMLKEAVRLQPELAEARNNYALALQDGGLLDEARKHYERAVTLAPGNSLMHFNLAQFYGNIGRLEDAVESYKRSIALDSAWKKPRLNLGTIYRKQGQVTKAIECFEALLEKDPGFNPALHNLGNVYSDRGDTEKALDCFYRVLSSDPDLPNTRSSALLTRHYRSVEDPVALSEAHREWERIHCRGVDSHGFIFSNSRDPDRPLKVGYLSPDFHNHSVSYFMAPVFSAHRTRHVAVYAYSDNVYQDETTHRLMAHAAQWHPVGGMSDRDLARLIHGHGIDILVDLAGHTAHNRLSVFARRPAPVQVTYLGYPDTTGLSTMDYRITDDVADPPGSESLYTETLVRLPNGFLCYQPSPDAPPVSMRSGNGVVFGSFNNSAKLSRETIGVWAEILHRLPDSRLCIKTAVFVDDGARERVLELFRKEGVADDRITLWTRTASTAEHLALYNEIDIALDTIPYNGTTTTCEALWMGTPVVSMNGNIHVARVGASILRQIGLDDLVAEGETTYVETAVSLASDKGRLGRLQGRLRRQVAASSLMDADDFVSDLEAAYHHMWRKWCENGRDDEKKIETRVSEESPSSNAVLNRSADDIVNKAVLANREGEELFELGNVEGARNSFNRAIGLDPDSTDAHNNLGVLHWSQGHHKEAVACLKRALQIDPANPDALTNLETILGSRQRNRDSSVVSAGNGVAETSQLAPVQTHDNRPVVRILHHMARSGGTVISKCLGCMEDVVLLSEIHPLGTKWFNPLDQARLWYNLLTDADIEKVQQGEGVSFNSAIALINQRSLEQNKTLIIRDWSHLDFTAVPFVEKPSYQLATYEILNEAFKVQHIATVRHPIDQWLSLERQSHISGRISPEAFMKGYLKFAEHAKEIGFIRYEDFVKNPALYQSWCWFRRHNNLFRPSRFSGLI